MEQAARAAGIADNVADPDTDPSRDVELGRTSTQYYGRNASRASLPLSHRRSQSIRSRTGSTALSRSSQQQGHDEAAAIGTAVTTGPEDPATIGQAIGGQEEIGVAETTDEIPWGPLHPCFPHPNPHVPLNSPLHSNTKIIRIKRDWMIAGDLAPTFSRLYPEILEDYISEETFKNFVVRLNDILLRVFSPLNKRGWFDIVVGVATGWLWDDAGLSQVKRGIKEIENYIDTWNREVGFREGVEVISLRRTAYLNLDIQIPEPQITIADGNNTETELVNGDVTPRDQNQLYLGRRGSGRSSNTSGSYVRVRDGTPLNEPDVPPIPQAFLQSAGRSSVGDVTVGG